MLRLASLLFTLQLLTRARKVSGTTPWLHSDFDVLSKVYSLANISFLNVCPKSIISSLLLMKIICIAFLIFELNISSGFVLLSLKSKLVFFFSCLLLYWLFQVNFDIVPSVNLDPRSLWTLVVFHRDGNLLWRQMSSCTKYNLLCFPSRLSSAWHKASEKQRFNQATQGRGWNLATSMAPSRKFYQKFLAL